MLPFASPRGWFIGLVSFWAVLDLVYTWAWLWGEHAQKIPGPAVVGLVTAVAGFEGCFAVGYYLLSRMDTASFNPSLNRVQAAYFAVSTATTTGIGDIHPATDGARLLVTAQMTLSLFLVVTAISTVFTRFFESRQGKRGQ